MTGHGPRTAPDPPRRGRHRRPRGSDALTVAALTARLTAPAGSGTGIPRSMAAWGMPTSSEGIKVSAAQVGMRRSCTAAGFEGIEVYAAASRAGRSARDAITRLAVCADRVHVAVSTVVVDAAETAQELAEQADAIADAVNRRLRAIEEAEHRLTATLEALDAAKAGVGEADRALRRFHPFGGTLVASRATRTLMRERLDRATAVAVACHHRADNATYRLVREIIAGERAVRAVEHLVDHVLDLGLPVGTVAAPPRWLRLVRAALPPSQQLDWWRELWSLFAECHPDERRAQTTSQLLNAPRTVWSGWALSRRLSTEPSTEEERS